MTLVEIGTVSIAPEFNAPLATTTGGGIAIGASIGLSAVVLILVIALLLEPSANSEAPVQSI